MVILDLYVLACVFVAAGKEMFLLGGQFLLNPRIFHSHVKNRRRCICSRTVLSIQRKTNNVCLTWSWQMVFRVKAKGFPFYYFRKHHILSLNSHQPTCLICFDKMCCIFVADYSIFSVLMYIIQLRFNHID